MEQFSYTCHCKTESVAQFKRNFHCLNIDHYIIIVSFLCGLLFCFFVL